MGPIDYSGAFAGPSPTQAFVGGLQLGNEMVAMQTKQQQQAQRQQVLSSLLSNPNPTAADYANASVLLPDLREHFDQAWKMRSAAQQEGELSRDSQVYSALVANRPEVAAQQARSFAESLRNSGDEQRAQLADTFAKMIDADPALARMKLGLKIAAAGEKGKTVLDSATAMQEAPAKLRQANADATIKEAEAAGAAEKVQLGNAKLGEDVATAQLKRQIDVLDTQIRTADSETRRGELQLQRDKLDAELTQKQADRAKAGQADMEAATAAMATVDSILNHPGMTGFFFGPGTINGKLMGNVPGTESRDFRALLDTLKSQSFMTQIDKMRGMGQLTEIEGKKITDAVANLDPDQSEKQLRAQLGIVRAQLQKAQSRMTQSGTAPTSGAGAVVMTHPTYGTVTETTINSLMQRNPGATRDQVLQFLRSTGGK